MCGICAVFGRPGEHLLDAFEIMLELQLLRGKDSTGVAVFRGNERIGIKDTVLPFQLMKTKEYQDNVANHARDNYAYIGHCRSATRGSISQENAHPFIKDHITMVHNGTLITRLPDTGKFDTDSEGIAQWLATKGPKETWKELDGAAALIWHDAKNNSLNVLRNFDRPLHFAYTKKMGGVLIASEASAIERAAKDVGIKLKDNDKIWYPKEHHHFIFQLKDNKVVPYSSEYTPRPFAYKNHWGERERLGESFDKADGLNSSTTTSKTGNTDITSENKTIAEQIKENIKSAEEGTRKANNRFLAKNKKISEKEFNQRYAICFFCQSSLEGEYETATIIDSETAVCADCTETANMNGVTLSTSLKGA